MTEKLATVLDLIDNGSIQLPEFQRGYVWNRDQVRGLMRSLYRRYPVGSLLLWQTRSEAVAARGTATMPLGYVDVLLDGQQRITTLYGIIRGKPPAFFEGNAEAFMGLYFHLDDETFEFYGPAKMKGNPLWVDVTTLMRSGLGPLLSAIQANSDLAPRLGDYIDRANNLLNIRDLELHSERITGEDKTVDVVVEIFDRVNSGGTKLSKADLALAKICAANPVARTRLREALGRWKGAGFDFKMDWLLRVVNAVATGEAMFGKLAAVPSTQFISALDRSERSVNTLLNNISTHLGLDYDRVLSGRFSLAVMARILDRQGGRFTDARERDKLLYWYVHSFLWARYAGSSETVLNQDLQSADEGGVDQLIERLLASRGDLRVRPVDFAGYSFGARFYPLLYLLTRVRGARDLWNGAPVLSAGMLGRLASLQVHHIFPKAKLYAHANRYTRGDVNAIANFCFLTQETNLWVTDRDPAEYFAEVEAKYPGALASQWIPLDRDLWNVDRYRDFLDARRELLSKAANDLLDALVHTEAGPAADLAAVAVSGLPRSVVGEEIDERLAGLLLWAKSVGLAEPLSDVEVEDPDSGDVIVIAEAFWPEGLQEGQGDPVILELDPLASGVEGRLSALGYRVFVTTESFRKFVETRLREAAEGSDAESTVAVP